MAETPVDYDPFSAEPVTSGGSAVAVDHDPFASERTGYGALPRHPQYGIAQSAEYGLSLGQSPKIRALRETVAESLAGGIPEGLSYKLEAPGVVSQYQPMDFWSRYQRNLGRYEAQREGYNASNPLAPLAEVGAAAVPATIAAEATPGLAALRGMGLGGRILAGEAVGAEAGALQTPVTGGDLGQNISTGVMIGGALPGGANAARGAILPAIDPQVAQAAQAASGLGVNLRPTQIAMSKVVQKADKLFASGYNDAQLKDFTRAVSKTIGADTDVLNATALEGARDTLRTGFDQIALQTPRMQWDPAIQQELKTAVSRLVGVAPDAQRQVKDVVSHIVQTFGKNGGWIDGKAFQNLTQYKGPIGNLASAGNAPMVREIGGDIHEAMLNLLDRNAPAGTRDKLAELKTQWSNARQIESAVQDSGPAGLIDPKKIFSATKGSKPGDLRTLGQVGPFMPSATPAGTAGAEHAVPKWFKIGAAAELPFAAMEMFHNPEATLAALGLTAGGYAAGRGVGALMASPAFRNAALARALATPGAPGALERFGIPATTGTVNALGGTGQ